MTGFEPQTSGIESGCSTNWATPLPIFYRFLSPLFKFVSIWRSILRKILLRIEPSSQLIWYPMVCLSLFAFLSVCLNISKSICKSSPFFSMSVCVHLPQKTSYLVSATRAHQPASPPPFKGKPTINIDCFTLSSTIMSFQIVGKTSSDS